MPISIHKPTTITSSFKASSTGFTNEITSKQTITHSTTTTTHNKPIQINNQQHKHTKPKGQQATNKASCMGYYTLLSRTLVSNKPSNIDYESQYTVFVFMTCNT